MALHFIAFSGDEYTSAVRVFGKPDFIHRYWDSRAASMIIDGDVAVFAKGTIDDPFPSIYSFDDSQVM